MKTNLLAAAYARVEAARRACDLAYQSLCQSEDTTGLLPEEIEARETQKIKFFWEKQRELQARVREMLSLSEGEERW